MGQYISTKTYGHERGYAVSYRQWRADSHCNLLHGYSLSFYLEFESDQIDVRNWVVDFGSLKTFKDFLDENFDHTMLVSQDDPEFKTFELLHQKKLAKMVVVEKTGCEGLSRFLYDYVNEIWLPNNGYNNVHCNCVKVAETPANSAWFYETKDQYENRKQYEIIYDSVFGVVGVDEVENLDLIKKISLRIQNEFKNDISHVTKEYITNLYKEGARMSIVGIKHEPTEDKMAIFRKNIGL